MKNAQDKTGLPAPSLGMLIQYGAEGAAVGEWVEPNKEEQTEGAVE